ncbi:MAG: flagellar biosynthesis protein FlgL [Sulfobacillus thermotolerans]|uniref:Flagellar biosynthesis protein FlgL n=1 Tax=Sulfobacillus thermotolerans TaxID=338644 RepID=A0ABM6RUU3_9FIRM|nr:flagellar biosynthesis protein FlgL [Sulfobacillus thermotolerans]MCY0908209.1 flagellar biosynthesis protein FlgL [Sulfobacillus thermotolerans]
MQITPLTIRNNLLANMQTQYQTINQLQEEASTGQSFQVPSDNPEAVTSTMSLSAALTETTAYQNSATAAQNVLNVTSGALQNMQQLWQKMISVTVQASSNALTPTDRQALAQEVEQAQTSLGQLLNTRYEGSYIFNGYNQDTPPVTASGVSLPTSTQSSIYQIGQNAQVTINLTGMENAGQPSGTNYLATVYNDLSQLATAVTTGASASQAMLGTLQTDEGYLSTAQSIVGGRMQRVTQAQTQLTTLAQNLNQTIAQVSGANMTAVTVQLTQEEQAYQAALQSGAQILSISLLNYIHP